MTRTKRVLSLKKLYDYGGHAVYGSPCTKKKDIGSHHFLHDNRLRDCLAKFLNDRNLKGIEQLSIGRTEINPDAYIGNLYFEFDNGHMDDDQLSDKIRNNYSGNGAFRVIFFMRHRYDDPEGEIRRLDKLFEIIKKTLPSKKGRVIGACYSQYLKDGAIYNVKGDKIFV